MTPPDLFEHRNSPNAGSRLQDRHNLAVPNIGQWVRPPPATRGFALLKPRVDIPFEAAWASYWNQAPHRHR